MIPPFNPTVSYKNCFSVLLQQCDQPRFSVCLGAGFQILVGIKLG